ncbi:MAG: hypothetical protein E8D47_12850 [Nitrospira sp.]|nr:MAG: hypothetical protein E8D47_12850 [Nitrospira sp.]
MPGTHQPSPKTTTRAGSVAVILVIVLALGVVVFFVRDRFLPVPPLFAASNDAVSSGTPLLQLGAADPSKAGEELIQLSTEIRDGPTLQNIAVALISVGDIPHARQVVQKIADPQQRATAIGYVVESAVAIAIAQKQTALLNQLPVFATMMSGDTNIVVWTSIARGKAYMGDVEGVRQAAANISDNEWKWKVFVTAAQAAKEGGHRDHARTLLDLAGQTVGIGRDRWQKTQALRTVTEDALQKGLPDEAGVLLMQMYLAWFGVRDDYGNKLTQLTLVAKTAAQTGHAEIAEEILQELIKDKERFITIQGPPDFSLTAIAALAGNVDRTLAGLDQAEQHIKQSPPTDHRGLEGLIESVAQFSNRDQARRILDRAWRVAEKIGDPGAHARSLIAIQKAAVKWALETKDRGFLDLAAEAVWEPDPGQAGFNAGYLDPIILAAVQLGDRKRVSTFLERSRKWSPAHSIEIARKIAETTNEGTYLRYAWQAAESASGLGMSEMQPLIGTTVKVALASKDVGLLESARRGTKTIANPVTRASVLGELVDAGSKLGAPQLVRQLADDLTRVADGIQDPRQRGPVQGVAVRALALSGFADQARTLLSKADQAAAAQPDARDRTYLWGQLAQQAALGALKPEAVTLFEKANAALTDVVQPDKTQLQDWLEKTALTVGQQTNDSFFVEFAARAVGTQPAHAIASGWAGEDDIAAAKTTKDPSTLAKARGLTEGLPVAARAHQLNRIIDVAVELANSTRNRSFLDEARRAMERIPTLNDSDPEIKRIAEVVRKFEQSAQGSEAAAGLKDPFGKDKAVEKIARAAASLGDWDEAYKIAHSTESKVGTANALAAAVRVWAEQHPPS